MHPKPQPSAVLPALTLEECVVSYKGQTLSTDEFLHAIELGRHILSGDGRDEIGNDLRGLAQIFWGLDHEDGLRACDWQVAHFFGKLLEAFAIRASRGALPQDVTVTVKAQVTAVA